MVDKDFYNEASAAKLGWDASWFGLTEYDSRLVKKIREFQREIGLKADGMLGPVTFRRLVAHREAEEEYENNVTFEPGDKAILYKGKKYPIKWDKVILPSDPNGLEHTSGFKEQKRKRNVSMFVTHWDVCLNSRTCYKILQKRGISIHFAIDNDGTIYQFLDMNHIGWHASSRTINRKAVGVEIANAYYPKYQSWYKKNGFGERPMITDASVHGKPMKPFMDFYPVQKEALKALMEAVHLALGIPLETPEEKTVSKEVRSGNFKVFVHHFHCIKSKIDCAGLDLKPILEEIKDEQ